MSVELKTNVLKTSISITKDIYSDDEDVDLRHVWFLTQHWHGWSPEKILVQTNTVLFTYFNVVSVPYIRYG
jgi:hypothetical protein